MKEPKKNEDNHSAEFVVIESFMEPDKRPVHESGIDFVPLNRPPVPPEEKKPPVQNKKKPELIKKKIRNKYYTRATYLFSLLFLSLIGYMVYFNLMLAENLNNNVHNAKGDIAENYVTRGSIYSSDGETLAYTETDETGNEYRVYPWSYIFSHVVGYTENGKSGIEAIYNNDLLTSNSSVMDRVGSEAHNKKRMGDSLYLTLDSKLQEAAFRALGFYKGAVVVLEPKTGKILAMVSKPDFDPNEMSSMWEILNLDESNSPLLNRATQGLYPPGSTFKIITALEYIKENPDTYMMYDYECYGSFQQDDVLIKCYDYEMHGYESLQDSFQHSCNTSFANIGSTLDINSFADLADVLLFNNKLPVVLPYSKSRFYLNENSTLADIMTTSIGQGQTLVSPFHMALIVSAIANNGKLMHPYIVDEIQNTDGIQVKQTKPSIYKEMMTPSEASILQDMMRSVVEGGTGSALWNDYYTVAGKTGSAEYINPEYQDFSTHSWFVGYSNIEDPDIVVAVIAEDGGTGSAAAVPIARDIFDAYYY